MKLELSDLNNGSVLVGDKLNIRAMFQFDEETSLLWSGVRLFTNPPCNKNELQISKEEIFSIGQFEAGNYLREKSILIKNNVVPTIKKRNLLYNIELILRQRNPINPEDDLIIKRKNEIDIKVDESKLKINQPNPIAFSISGLNVNLSKDIFKPGETIKVNYSSKNLREIEVRLLQKANLVCYCEKYGKNCTNVEELPPAIAGDSKTTNTDEGFVFLKVPTIAEPSHNYLWEPTEMEHWGLKYGDYSQWSLLVLGRRKPEFGRDIISFEVPLTIVTKPPIGEKKDIDLFSKGVTGGMNIFEDIGLKFQKRFQILSIDADTNSDPNHNIYKIRIKNISNENLQGITVKTSGLQEGLFETNPSLHGFSTWNMDEEKEVIYKIKQSISAIISILEDNSQKAVKIQTPIPK